MNFETKVLYVIPICILCLFSGLTAIAAEVEWGWFLFTALLMYAGFLMHSGYLAKMNNESSKKDKRPWI